MGPRIIIEEGDLTRAAVDAIVNAANNDLRLGAGVAGAIREAGGPSIQAECDRIGPIAIGEAAITGGGSLPAKHVIHAASMGLGGRTTAESLESSTRAALRIARERGLKSIAFPAIGTGVAGFPLDACAEIMLDAVEDEARDGDTIEEVRFVLFGREAYESFRLAHEARR
ncbi:MAG: macro domain-containing protein [Myxococcales bacterium]|nr:macro domain-containing protein [Myxococcales bacterium]